MSEVWVALEWEWGGGGDDQTYVVGTYSSLEAAEAAAGENFSVEGPYVLDAPVDTEAPRKRQVERNRLAAQEANARIAARKAGSS